MQPFAELGMVWYQWWMGFFWPVIEKLQNQNRMFFMNLKLNLRSTCIKQYLGDLLPAFPVPLFTFPLQKDDDDSDRIRTVLSVSEEDHSMTFAGEIRRFTCTLY